MSKYQEVKVESSVNRRLRFLQLAEFIEAEAREADAPAFDMGTYGQTEPCNTAACIAGTAVWLWDRKAWDRAMDILTSGNWVGADLRSRADLIIDRAAKRLLGLRQEKADQLFVPENIGYVQRHDAAAVLRWLADHPNARARSVEKKWEEIMDKNFAEEEADV